MDQVDQNKYSIWWTTKVRNLTDDDKETNELFAKGESKMNEKKLAVYLKIWMNDGYTLTFTLFFQINKNIFACMCGIYYCDALQSGHWFDI